MNSVKLFIFCILVLGIQISNAQIGAFRVKTGGAINIGYTNYRYLTFGQGLTPNNDGPWALEEFDEGMNFWRPYSSGMGFSGNYFLHIHNLGHVGIGQKANPGFQKSYGFLGGKKTQNFKLQVNGNVVAHDYFTYSDSNVKKDIMPLDMSYGLSAINQLKPVKYKYKDNFISTEIPDSKDQNKMATSNEQKSQNFVENSTRFGLLAQELKTVLPDMVSQVGEFETINYVSLVPVLIKGIQEQSKLIEDQDRKIQILREEIENLKGSNIAMEMNMTKIYQIAPNPFKDKTYIAYIIEEKLNFNDAKIDIRDVQSKLIASFDLPAKQRYGKIEFAPKSVNLGSYICTLRIDGQIKDSKIILLEN
jgi:hypothetical protein